MKIDRQNSGFSEAGSGTVHPWKPRWGAPSRKLAPVRCTLSEAGSGTVHPLGSRSRTRFDDEKYLSLASQPPAPSPKPKSIFSLTPSSPYCSPSQLLIKKDPFVFTPKRWSPGYFPRGDNVPLSGSWILRFAKTFSRKFRGPSVFRETQHMPATMNSSLNQEPRGRRAVIRSHIALRRTTLRPG